MLSGVLNSDKALDMNIEIMRAFIGMKQIVIENNKFAEKLQQLENQLGEHDTQLGQIYKAIEILLDKKMQEKKWEDREQIGFKPNK